MHGKRGLTGWGSWRWLVHHLNASKVKLGHLATFIFNYHVQLCIFGYIQEEQIKKESNDKKNEWMSCFFKNEVHMNILMSIFTPLNIKGGYCISILNHQPPVVAQLCKGLVLFVHVLKYPSMRFLSTPKWNVGFYTITIKIWWQLCFSRLCCHVSFQYI